MEGKRRKGWIVFRRWKISWGLGKWLSQENSFSVDEVGHLETKLQFHMSSMRLKHFSNTLQKINYWHIQ